jgi:hypothetical protein
MKFTEVQGYKFLDYYNKKITIVNKDDKMLRFQIPTMYMPFGVSGFVPPDGNTKWNVDFSVKGDEFYKFVKNFERDVIENVQKQSRTIFGHEKTFEELSIMFHSNMKEDPGSSWEPRFRAKVDDHTHMFNEKQEELTDELTPNLYSRSHGTAIVEVSSVWFINKKFGVTWKISQLKLKCTSTSSGFQFVNV